MALLAGADGENPFAPLDKIHDTSKASLRDVYKAAMREIKDSISEKVYLVGGRDVNGSFCIYEIRRDGDGNVVTQQRKPAPPLMNFAVSLCLPPSTVGSQQRYFDMLAQAVTNSKTHDGALHGMYSVIGAVARIDNTVNTNMSSYSVF